MDNVCWWRIYAYVGNQLTHVLSFYGAIEEVIDVSPTFYARIEVRPYDLYVTYSENQE